MKKFAAMFLLFLCSCASSDDVTELNNKLSELEARVMQLENRLDSVLQTNHHPKKKQTSESLSAGYFYSIPQKESITQPSAKRKSGYELSQSRCQATTKRGTQCKRSAQDGRSYCWQH